MVKFFLRIFDYFRTHRRVMFALLGLLCAGLIVSTSHLNPNENILDFLPVDKNHRKAMNIYQNLSAADQIIVLVQHKDTTLVEPYELSQGVEAFLSLLSQKDTTIKEVTSKVDNDAIFEVTDFIYNNIALFLDEDDYKRLDTLLTEEYITKQIQSDKNMLVFPTGGLLSEHISQDPLNLFTPTVQKLQNYQISISYQLYDDYIFTKDLKKAIVMLRSPFGSNETNNNGRLVKELQSIVDEVVSENPELEIHLSGAPVIAVSNSKRIKIDSILSILIALVLILALLLFEFRSLKALVQIGVSVAFGLLFAIGLISLIREEVSIIIIGIASIIIGIAVNYPLHFILHLKHETDVRAAIKELIAPLVIGNITTVGAFLCLVTMTAPALRDFGLFAACMLIGTIIFVILFLPNIVKSSRIKVPDNHNFSSRIPAFEKSPIVMILIGILTVVFAYFSQFTTFDSNMSNINYMTKEQRSDMAAFNQMLGGSGLSSIYVASEGETWDEALSHSELALSELQKVVNENPNARLRSASPFLPSLQVQEKRLRLWADFVSRNKYLLTDFFHSQLAKNGFKRGSFSNFEEIVNGNIGTLSWEELSPLTKNLFSTYLSSDEGLCTIIDYVDVPSSEVSAMKATLKERVADSYNFDIQGLNSSLASSLSNDFNAACWSCGLIVFFFLWLSFGRIELSIISFLPMAVSWLWILGIMQLTGTQFNIVNIILATFIFGQGDDYTIFITEGLIYEYAYGRKLLKSYKHSIIVSALIMLIGIGSLIVAKHPAMRSLAEVTIIGMTTVLLMAYVLPPFFFNLLTRHHNGKARLFPLSFKSIWLLAEYRNRKNGPKSTASFRPQIISRYLYKGTEVERRVRKNLETYACFSQWIDIEIVSERVLVLNSAYGEFALLLALVHPEIEVVAYEADNDAFDLSRNLAEIPSNLRFVNALEETSGITTIYAFKPSADQKALFANKDYSVVYIPS